MTLSESPKDATFTLRRDFNMTKFLLIAKPDEAFKVARDGDSTFVRTNTSSNIKLKDNIELNEDNVVALIKAKRKVLIYYEMEKRLDCYNVDEFEMLDKVVRC